MILAEEGDRTSRRDSVHIGNFNDPLRLPICLLDGGTVFQVGPVLGQSHTGQSHGTGDQSPPKPDIKLMPALAAPDKGLQEHP